MSTSKTAAVAVAMVLFSSGLSAKALSFSEIKAQETEQLIQMVRNNHVKEDGFKSLNIISSAGSVGGEMAFNTNKGLLVVFQD